MFLSKQCYGCGLIIQHERVNEPGFSPKKDSDLCQSCFRLRHYGDISRVKQIQVDSDTVLSRLKKLDALFVWVVDLYHLEESAITGLSRHFFDKDIMLVGTKRELLPDTVSEQKIVNQVTRFLSDANISVIAMTFVSNFGMKGKQELLDLMKFYNKHKDIVLFGTTNAGKSTLLNALSSKDANISTSYLPGTTLDMIEVDSPIGKIIDSPGIQQTTPLIEYLKPKALALLQPARPIKARNYQLSDNQALWVGGLGYIEIIGATDLTVTCYLPEGVDIHRTKSINAQKQYNRLQTHPLAVKESPLLVRKITESQPKFDIVIHEVGFICINGNYESISTHFPKEVVITTRKAFI